MQMVNSFNTNEGSHNIFVLMCKDLRVCQIDMSTGEASIFRKDLLPFDLFLDDSDDADLFNNLIVFTWWCAHRILSLDREYAKNILNSCGLRQVVTDKDKATVALQYKCLSLRDFYWVQTVDTCNTWKDISLFENSLSNAVVDIALLGKNMSVTNKDLITSDLATDGLFPKAWLRDKGCFWLLKGNRNDSVNKEFYASKYLQMLGFEVLHYEKEYYNGELVTKSKCFTNEDIGYVTAGDMSSNFELDLNYEQYYMMNLCDFLVGNSDRHQDNWGYLFNDKREIVDFAPIFDFNHAFEAPPDFLCLPERLFNRDINMLDMARTILYKYDIRLKLLPEENKYAKYINERIKLLIQ